MRIAYFVQWDISSESGVLKKIVRSIYYWEQDGHTVKLFVNTPSGERCKLLDNMNICSRIYSNHITSIISNICLIRDVFLWKPDVVYFRMNKYFPGNRLLFRKFPTYLEINTDDKKEYKRTTSWLIYAYHILTRKLMIQNAKGLVLLTEENAENYKKYKKPFVVIGDSIALKEFQEPQPTGNKRPQIVFMASKNEIWHGIDKFLYLSQHFHEWDFHIIGSINKEIKASGNNLYFHGFLKKSEYHEILTHSDIAFATLSLYKIKMNETAPLKVREYLAYGIPVIIGYRDTDFLDEIPYILGLPNTEDNVKSNLKEIEQFVNQWFGHRVARQQVAHLDVSVKEQKRLDFILQWLNNKGN